MCFIEILLEPETRFIVVMVEKDKDYPNVTRVVLDVKKTPPILEEAIKNFVEMYDTVEESKLHKMLGQKYSVSYGAAHFSLHNTSYDVLRQGEPVTRTN